MLLNLFYRLDVWFNSIISPDAYVLYKSFNGPSRGEMPIPDWDIAFNSRSNKILASYSLGSCHTQQLLISLMIAIGYFRYSLSLS